jgi:TP901 family phage tail tape measure protein
MEGAGAMIKEESIMAEDLKIRVKVEPNTTGLQGKLDEAAKKYKLNIELFDEKSLVSQISNVQTKLNTLINNTAHKLTTLSANAQQNTATIAAGMRSLIDTYGDVADIQKEISSNAKGLNLIDQTKIEESKSKIAELKKELEDLRKTQKQGNSYKSDFVGTVLGEEGFDADAVGKSLQDVLNRMKNVAGKGANEIKAEIASIFNDSSDIDSLALMNTINDIFYDMDGELDDFKKKYGDAYTELFKINGAIGLDKKESGYPASLVKTASKYADDLTRIYEQIQTSVNNISKGTEVKTNLTNLIDSLQQFYKVSGFLNNGENLSDKENAITAKIDKEQAKIDALLQKSGSSAENAGKDAGSRYVKAFSEVVTKNINQDLDLESLVGKTFDLNGLLEKAFGSDTKIGVIENYKKNLQSELAQIASQTEKMFDVDLTTLDNDSAKNISTLKSNAIAVRTVMDDISKLLERTKGGVGNNEEYEQFKTYLQQLQGYVSNIKEVYNSVDSINSGELTIKNDSDDKLTERASKLEESMRRLVQLQLSLTLEKVKTLEAENDIIGATSKNSDALKTALEKQREITKMLNSDSGKSGKTDNKPDSKAAKEAEDSSGKAKENLQDAAAAVKELKTKGLDTVLKTVQKFVDGVCSDQSKVSAVSDKISEFNTKMAGFESAVTNYCKAITDLNTYFEQNAAILSALKGAYDIDSAQEKNKVKKETEQQTSAKITALLNKVNTSSEKIVSAVNDASNALKEISTALSAAAESAGSINGDGQIVLGAIQKLDTIFQQYSKALNNAGILNAADKPADEKTATTKKHKTKKKETVTEPTDTVSASIKKMEAVFDEFTAVAEATTGFAGKVDAVISAGDSIKEIIAKFNSIGDGSAESAQKTVEDQQAAIQEISAQVKASKTALAKSDSGIQQATTAVQEAVKSASSIDADAQALIKAGKVLSSIFKAYVKILDELQDSVDKVSGVDAKTITTSMTKMKNFVKNAADAYAEAAEKATSTAKVDKKTVKKEKTEKADAQKADTKPTASIDTDKLNQVASDIRSVMAKFNRVAKTTDTFAENINKLLDAGTKISKVIKKFNGIDTTAVETVKSNVAAKAKTGNTDFLSRQFADKEKTIVTLKSLLDKFNANVGAAGGISSSKAFAGDLQYIIDELDKLGSASDLGNLFKSTGTEFDNIRSKAYSTGESFDTLASMVSYFRKAMAEANSEATKYNANQEKLTNGRHLVKDSMSLLGQYNTYAGNTGTTTEMRTLAKEIKDLHDQAVDANIDFINDKSEENLRTYLGLIDKLSQKMDLLKAKMRSFSFSQSDKSTQQLEQQLEQLKNLPGMLERAERTLYKQAGKKGAQDIPEFQQTIRFINDLKEQTFQALDSNDQSGLTALFSSIAKEAQEAHINVENLNNVVAVLQHMLNKTGVGIDIFNGAKLDERNINSWMKSINNTIYTAQRYLKTNSKIKQDPELYAKFQNFLEPYKEMVDKGLVTNENGQEIANKITSDWSEVKRAIQEAGYETDTFGEKMKKLFEVNIKSQLANQIINGVQQGLRQVYQNVVDIDSAMTELKKVTDESSSTYDKFLSEAGDRAKTVGSTVSDIINATADYSRLGYNLEDAKTLADVSAIYYNVGDDLDSFSTATDNIVGTMKAFNMQADEAIDLVDKLDNVSNNYAVSSGDLGDILQRSASAMEAAGNTLDQTIALGTAMNSVLQSADTTGTTLKVLALRLRGATTELASMGEETDGVATSTSKLRAQIAALTNVDGSGGFDILTDSGAFKSTYDIIQGIAKVYDRMSDVDQASLLELIAGKNRANGVAALLKQASQAEDVLNTSLNSSGVALKENQRVLDSIEGKIKRFQATFQSFSANLLDSKLVKCVIDLGTAAMNTADNFVKMGEILPTIAAGISGVVTGMGGTGGMNMPFYAGRITA